MFKQKENLTIPKAKFVIGIVIGLFYSFSFYSFLYLGREAFRYFSVTEYYDLLVLSKSEIFFYNLFFAFIATIMGQSICFTYWFDTPKRIFNLNQRKKVSIVNDQRNLNWFFISWFSKVAVVFGFIFCMTFEGGFYAFSIYPNYVLVAVLIIVVLYLNIWNTFRQTFKRKSSKWIFISLLSVVSVSLVFSNINLIDYKSINENFLRKNVYYTFQLDVPEVKLSATKHAHGFMFRSSLLEEAFVVMDKSENQEGLPVIIADNEKVSIENFIEVIKAWQETRPAVWLPLMNYRFHVDKRIPMSFIEELNQELINHGIIIIGYAVVPIEREFDKRYYHDKTITLLLQSRIENLQAELQSIRDDSIFNTFIYIEIDKEGNYKINNTFIEKHELFQHTNKELRKYSESFLFVLTLSEETRFGEYIYAFTEIFEAIYNLRNEFSMITHGDPFSELDFDLQREIREKFPYSMIKICSD